MKKKIHITDTLSNKLVAEYELNLQISGGIVDNKEYFEEAWRCALEDNLVNPDKKAQYSFNL